MYIDINKIGPEGYRLDRVLDLAELEGGEDEHIRILEARLRGRAERGKRGVDLSANLHSRVELDCCRCLEPFESTISADFSLTIVPEAAEFGAGEIEIDDEDASLFYAPEGKADLGVIAAEQILLNMPLKPVCDPGCKGLCPTCGVNRNKIECDCRSEAIDPRFAPLLDLKQRMSDS
jgi:uncharacterized protein